MASAKILGPSHSSFSFFALVRDALGWSHAMHYSKKAFIDYSTDLTF